MISTAGLTMPESLAIDVVTPVLEAAFGRSTMSCASWGIVMGSNGDASFTRSLLDEAESSQLPSASEFASLLARLDLLETSSAAVAPSPLLSGPHSRPSSESEAIDLIQSKFPHGTTAVLREPYVVVQGKKLQLGPVVAFVLDGLGARNFGKSAYSSARDGKAPKERSCSAGSGLSPLAPARMCLSRTEFTNLREAQAAMALRLQISNTLCDSKVTESILRIMSSFDELIDKNVPLSNALDWEELAVDLLFIHGESGAMMPTLQAFHSALLFAPHPKAQKSGSVSRPQLDLPCHRWNKDKCSLSASACRFQHRCQICGSGHRKDQCPDGAKKKSDGSSSSS